MVGMGLYLVCRLCEGLNSLKGGHLAVFGPDEIGRDATDSFCLVSQKGYPSL